MAVYTVHEPPLTASATPQPERFVFVRDGFSIAALLFGPLWMLRHRMWLVLLGYVLVTAVLSVAVHLEAYARVEAVALTLLALLIGFEAGTLRRFTLARRSFRNIGVVVGDDLESAEHRFFETWVKKNSVQNLSAPGGTPAIPGLPRRPAAGPEVLGLFPEPGTRS